LFLLEENMKTLKKSIGILLGIAMACLLMSAPLMAQSNATINGIVRDPTGAILPGVSVTLTDKATQQIQTTVTSEIGSYVFPAVPPGQYALAFELPGFKKLLRENITANVRDIVKVDASLQIGTVSSEVTVNEEAPLIQAETAALGRVVEQVLVTGVPLSSRNFTQILALSPGVAADVPNAGQFGRNSVNIAANGARPWENSVVFNGMVVDNVNSGGFDDDNDKNGIPVPSPDAIQEFKVQTALYDAENGRQGGATVNIVTKTGANAYHGSVFEFFRNDALNANDWFLNFHGQPKGVLKQHQYGATFGGPIKKDRTFYFVSYQGTRQGNGISTYSTKTTFLPVLGDRSAAALGALYGGKSGQLGGVAVAKDGSNINPVALTFLNAKLPNGSYLIPDPQVLTPGSTTGTSAYAIKAIFHEEQILTNVDHSFSSNHRGAMKLFYADLPTTIPFETGGATVPGMGEQDRKSNMTIALHDTYTFSPSLLNEVRVGYARNYMIQVPVEPLTASSLGILRPVTNQGDGIPRVSVSGLFTIGPQTNNQQTIILHTYEAADTLHWIKGKHDIRLGANVNPTLETRVEVFLIRGTISFSSFPDFLLGMSAAQNGSSFSNISSSQAANGLNNRHPRYPEYSSFVQDDFRVNDRLNLNLGLRWQYYGSEIDKRGRKGNFDMRKAFYGSTLPAAGSLDGFVVPSNADKGRLQLLQANSPFLPPNYILPHKSLFDNDTKKAFSPRIGFAFRPIGSKNDFVMRGGYGIYWSAIAGTVFEQESFDPWMIVTTGGGNVNPAATFQNPYVVNPPPSNDLPIYIPILPGVTRSFLAIDPQTKLPYTQQWSLNTQYALHNFVFEVGYSGSKATHLIGGTRANQALLASPTAPIHNETTNTTSNVSLRAPTLEWAPSALSYYGSYFDATYNALQLSVKKQYSQSLTFTAGYTLSHGVDDIGASGSGRNQPIGSFTGDFYNRRANRGSADFDRRHRVVASYVYNIPGIFQNSALGRNLLGGWDWSGVTTLQSGKPFSITDSTAGTIYGASSYAQFAPGKGASDAVLSGRTQDRINAYFNTSVFAPAPSIGTGTGFGNSGRNILVGPGQANFDMALKKRFQISKTNDVSKLEFRSEFFNVFNHPNFSNPASARASPSSFGTITTMSAAPRIIQFALKYQF
jgi:hypothetical protein